MVGTMGARFLNQMMAERQRTLVCGNMRANGNYPYLPFWKDYLTNVLIIYCCITNFFKIQ